MELSEKLRDNFDEMVVYKDLKKTNFFSTFRCSFKSNFISYFKFIR